MSDTPTTSEAPVDPAPTDTQANGPATHAAVAPIVNGNGNPAGANPPVSVTASATARPVATSSRQLWIAPGLNELLPWVEPRCPDGGQHADGRPCLTCRGINMPWGNQLPIADDQGPDGNPGPLLVGPAAGVLAGVELNSDIAVAVLSFVAYIHANGQEYESVPGFTGFVQAYFRSVIAGVALAGIYAEIRRMAGPYDRVRELHEVVEDALADPTMTRERLIAHLTFRYATQTDDSAQPEQVLENRAATSVQNPHVSNITDPVTPAPGDLENTNGDLPDDHFHDKVYDYDDGQTKGSRKSVCECKKNTPAPSGDWEFFPGTDLSDPEWGIEEPHKFGMYRRLKNDHKVVDVREFPGLQHLDWQNMNHIKVLKKYRDQVRQRTEGMQCDTRSSWTLLEKETMMKLIDEKFNEKLKSKPLVVDQQFWQAIADGIVKALNGKDQLAGSHMARTSKVVSGAEISLTSQTTRAQTMLKNPRIGSPIRTWTAVKAQAQKFPDIKSMLPKNKPSPASKDPKTPRTPKTEHAKTQKHNLNESDTDDGDETNPKKPKLRKTSPEVAPKNNLLPQPPPPPPPAGGAGGIAGPMEGVESLASAPTPIEGH